MASVTASPGLLRSYAQTTGNVGKKAIVHDTLYCALLAAAMKKPGQLQSIMDADEQAQQAAKDLRLVASFARIPGKPSGPACAVFIDVLEETARPLNQRNVALVYVEAPTGQLKTTDSKLQCEVGTTVDMVMGKAAPVLYKREDFLVAVEMAARNAMSAVVEYNRGAVDGAELPRIEALQYCLVSGATAQRHPEASKLDVAVASLRGLQAVAKEAEGHAPEVYLSYDENVFAEALRTLKLDPLR